MSKKDPDSNPDPKKAAKQRRALRRRSLWKRPGELYQQMPESELEQQPLEPELEEGEGPKQKGRKGED